MFRTNWLFKLLDLRTSTIILKVLTEAALPFADRAVIRDKFNIHIGKPSEANTL